MKKTRPALLLGIALVCWTCIGKEGLEPLPTGTSTATPTSTPAPIPAATPVPPTASPEPTRAPTAAPTAAPTSAPTAEPPTPAPTPKPTPPPNTPPYFSKCDNLSSPLASSREYDLIGNVLDAEDGFLCGAQYCVGASVSGACTATSSGLNCTCLAGIDMFFRTLAGPGTCTVTITVRDKQGLTGTTSCSYSVSAP